MARPNKVKTSRYREKIDNWIIEGKGDTEIIELLKQQDPPEKIGRTTLYNYRKNDFNINKEATREYHEKKSKERLNGAVAQTVSDLEFLDNIITVANDTGLEVDPEKNISELDIKKLGIQAVRAKQEVFKAGSEDEKEFIITIVGVDSDEEDNVEVEPEAEEEHQPD